MSFGFTRNLVSSPSVLIFLAALLIYPAIDLKIRTGIWHLWNGDTVRFEGYDIPVQTNWVAETDDRQVAMLDVTRSYWRGQLHPTIVISRRVPLPKDAWTQKALLEFQEKYLKSINAQVFDRRTVDIDGEQVDCEATNDLLGKPPVPSAMNIRVECNSANGLSIMSYGDKQDLDTFFSIVSQIRKHND